MSVPGTSRQGQLNLPLRGREPFTAMEDVSENMRDLPLRPRDPPTTAADISEKTRELPLLGQLPLTFAVDVSGSTKGIVLRKETDAITKFWRSMSPELVPLSTILPWSKTALPSMEISQVEELYVSGGTDPGVLLQSSRCTSKLQDASLWFLLTDGIIREHRIQKFANAIYNAGIHGTACVIILFGERYESPFDCDVSVGISVFAAAPHCIFLFSDVETDIVYVLQAKGTFSNILPAGREFSSFGEWTRWEDLVTITYEDLLRVEVPLPVKLSGDMVPLSDGTQFDLISIYTGSISETDTLTLISDYSALDVILVAATTRGQRDIVRRWIMDSCLALQSHLNDNMLLPVEDIGGKATKIFVDLVRKFDTLALDTPEPRNLWQALHRSNSLSEFGPTKSNLRGQHHQNWISNVKATHLVSSMMEYELEEVLIRLSALSLHARSMHPNNLTPMTSPDSGDTSSYEARSTRRAKRHSSLVGVRSVSHLSESGQLSHDATPESRDHKCLFLTGFKGHRHRFEEAFGELSYYQTCPICGQKDSIQCLLLRINTSSDVTPSLPRINSGYVEQGYSIVLGSSYPGTDIILPLTSCDACAFILLNVGVLPNGERVDAALPLVPLDEDGNRQQWVQVLNRVYQHRFHDGLTLVAFLSSVCSEIDKIAKEEGASSGLMECLKWCCRAISKLDGVAVNAGLLPAANPWSTIDPHSVTLQQYLVGRFSDPWHERYTCAPPLLAYPIEGFVAIVRLASLTENITSPMIELCVWKRLLYHITEQYSASCKQGGSQEASRHLEDHICSPSPITSITVKKLARLFPALEQFERMGKYFAPIVKRRKYHAALAVFLHLMRAISSHFENLDARGLFDNILIREDQVRDAGNPSCEVFQKPLQVSKGDVVKLIKDVYELSWGPVEEDWREEANLATLEQLPSLYSVSVAQLGSHLPSLDQFRRLGDYFAPIETTTKYNAALAVFLHIMRKVSILLLHNHLEVGLFVKYIEDYGLHVQQADNQFCNVFDEPTLVGGGNVEKMVKDVYELH
ncbi:hypothetical protein BO85DRAFT_489346 [Aspergillus piperis CBS 112811]|uniref:Uncharacterized protein n=1 Tax=Aspergillus piperis CBS 112811 TaxID=1448313 RepID=A0A8G1R118_9EURO|nr:hypothetical protein BO85DRAFT_489346 [Aspergillus piperis CBS 112811]RAH56562.1 hypothetical protein BO85DRAFT_489346 [Aspergillus piperis CBS 112811]